MDWPSAFDIVKKSVVRIEMPLGMAGTGFFLRYKKGIDDHFVIATAYHVVGNFDKWGGPIDFTPPNGLTYRNIGEECRVIRDSNTDMDVALLKPTVVPSKNGQDVSMTSEGSLLDVSSNFPLAAGVEVGWVGFPGVIPGKIPSGFLGNIFLNDQKFIYVNGTFFKGVSGSPVVVLNEHDDTPRVIGLVSSRVPQATPDEPTIGTGRVVFLDGALQSLE